MIEFRDVHLRYGKKEVLKGISMIVPDGKITAILGPSGSGKSTIVKLMLGLIKPTQGGVFVDGIDITGMREEDLFPIRKTMGMVFQGNALFDSLSVADNMGFFLRENLRLPEPEIRERVQDQLKFAGLEGHEHQLPASLSGGMRKRIAIGRALIFGPKMVLLDEPFGGINPVLVDRLTDIVLQLNREQGKTFLLISHEMPSVMRLCEIVTVLAAGSTIAHGKPAEVRANPAVIEAYLGH